MLPLLCHRLEFAHILSVANYRRKYSATILLVQLRISRKLIARHFLSHIRYTTSIYINLKEHVITIVQVESFSLSFTTNSRVFVGKKSEHFALIAF